MAGRSPWQDGRRTWEKLNYWYSWRPADLTHASYAEHSLDALQDVRQIRGLLETAELHAVQTARLHGRSWAEIGTRLGIGADEARRRWGGES
jgi:hypothetical protein